MKKRATRILACTLAVGLLIGGAALGTNALFTDTETSNNKLTITTGTVDISLVSKEWIRNPKDMNNDGLINALDRIYENASEADKSKDGVFENVEPGDVFYRYIGVDNLKSTYDVTLEVKADDLAGIDASTTGIITVDDEDFKDGVEKAAFGKLPAGANVGGLICVKIADTPEASKALNGGKTFELDKTYTITATQKKAK